MSASNKLLQAAAGVGGEETDADFESTVLLLNADDASNGGQNNTFLDSSSNAHTITRNGNVTQGSFSPFSVDDGKWGNYFDGSGDYLDTTSSVKDLGTGDFTIDVFINPSDSSSNIIVDTRQTSSNSGWHFYLDSGNATFSHDTGAGTTITLSGAITLNTWSHIAVTRNSGTVSLYVNGTSQDSGTYTQNLSNGGNFRIGSKSRTLSGIGEFSGYMSNLRVVAGTALYTSNFTPSTTPLTDVSGTSLLTCQSNRFVDNSSNAHSITVNGGPKVVPFSPFPQTTAYDASTNGGSGYFDGTGNSLVVTSDASLAVGSGAFTIETWIYSPSGSAFFSSYKALYSTGSSSTSGTMDVRLSSAKKIAIFYGTSGSFTSTNAVSDNEWTHFALVREGTGTNQTKIYLNGVLDSSHTVSENFTDTNFKIGVNRADNTRLNDYLTDLRVVKGTAVYTADFTPPTAPLTDVTNTSLLCNFTNASIVDATGKNVLETVGNAQVDTTTFKYGTGAMEFDGTGDGLIAPNNEAFDFGSGDFTIEAWVYMTTTSHVHHICSKRTSNGASSTNWILEIISGDYVFNASDGSSYVVSNLGNAAGTINTWQHIAITRSGNDFKMFLDGTQAGSTITTSSAISSTARDLNIGLDPATSNNRMEGYIDDLRITKGIARYTANFTPPDKALPVIGEE